MLNELSILRPDDWHVHLREGALLPITVAASARTFHRCVIMPNLQQPLTTAKQIANYAKEIRQHIPQHSKFQPLLTMYLTDDSEVSELEAALKLSDFFGVKCYPCGVTTNSKSGVHDLNNCNAILEKMQEEGVPLLVHGESSEPSDDVFDREKIFINDSLVKVRQEFPQLKITLEHISSKEAAAYVREGNSYTAATITPQHLWYNRNDLLGDHLKPHLYCKPILKREADRLALVSLVRDGLPRVFLGSDSAPHRRQDKESSCGCAGVFSAPYLLEILAQIFEELGALDKMNDFIAVNGAKFYGYPITNDKITLKRQTTEIPEYVGQQHNEQLIPMGAGTSINWRIDE